jgi:NAD(P)-dependent dehydrogenase (short-subunit alcohol dehydrogenase family)
MISFAQEDRVLVTGASSGIGEAIALTLNSLGATVIANSRSRERLLSTREKAEDRDRFIIEACDLSEGNESLVSWVREIAVRRGRLRGMVHSAGMMEMSPLKATDFGTARREFDLNYFAGLALAKGFQHKSTNVGVGASLVFVSSISSLSGQMGIMNYSATKGAINAMVRSMAVELSAKGIRVNAVVPGQVATDMTRSLVTQQSDAYLHELENMYPLGPGRPQDVADLTSFLVSDRARWLTGQCVVVDGGRTLL